MKATSIIIKLDHRDPDNARLKEAVRTCREGKIVGFPTETVYGIGGVRSAPGIDQRLRDIKGRGEQKPFSLHIGDWDMIDRIGVVQTPAVRFFIRNFWPGPVTLILNGTKGGTVGVRFPKNKVARRLICEAGEPFVATSGNKSGMPSPYTAQQVFEQFGNVIDCLIDSGKTEFAHESTVLDLSGEEPVILRKGACASEVEKAVAMVKAGCYPKKKIIVVCTGNSCRSPMGEGWLKDELERRGLADLIEVSSCGTNAREGLPAASEAEFVMKNRGVDLSRHKSRLCRVHDIWCADLILVMSACHADSIEELLPGSRAKIRNLDVGDPIGLGIDIYEKTILELERKMKTNMNEIILLP
ncbi:MAG: Threonylcarbamoyl-AMP synthase [Candidatus Omnitrophica bacterium ADurb.Bin314]|nr:MAG: Threonylcarbamoyl-AMP synthase [Candidatus Omnitrophica bacterium ADurb.Bin314]